jgi:hypothetical protein
MKLRNSTDISNSVVKEVIRFVRPVGIANFDIMLKNAQGRYAGGRAYSQGSVYHKGNSPFVVLRVPRDTYPQWKKSFGDKNFVMSKRPLKSEGWQRTNKATFPLTLHTYQRGQLRGKQYHVTSRIEYLVYLAAHELRHLWQHKTGTKRRGMTFGSRGVASEIDTESYAIRKLREWRKKNPKAV